MAQHTFSASGVPSSAPSKTNQHYCDLSTGDLYISKGTSSVDDWVLLGASAPASGLSIVQQTTAEWDVDNTVYDLGTLMVDTDNPTSLKFADGVMVYSDITFINHPFTQINGGMAPYLYNYPANDQIRITLRQDTAANWTSENPVLALAEIGIETDTLKAKLGDDVTDWNSLDYWYDPTVTASGALLAANNLSDLADPATARTNLGLGDVATVDSGGPNTTQYLRRDLTWFTPATDVGGVAWGAISGTITDQADLIAAIAAGGSSPAKYFLMSTYATSGTGTQGDPYIGWDSAIDNTTSGNYNHYHFDDGMWFRTNSGIELGATTRGVHISGRGRIVYEGVSNVPVLSFHNVGGSTDADWSEFNIIEQVILDGGDNASHGFYATQFHRNLLRDVIVVNAPIGFYTSWAVCTYHIGPACSHGYEVSTRQDIVTGMYLDGASNSAVIMNPFMESTTGVAISINNTNNITIIGGSLENGNVGLATSNSKWITLMNQDDEVNSGGDVQVGGSCDYIVIQNCQLQDGVHFQSGNNNKIVDSNIWGTLTIDSGVTVVSDNSVIATLSNSGTFIDRDQGNIRINSQSTDYTLVAADAGKMVTISSSSPHTLTVPPNSSVAFLIGTAIDVAQVGTGAVTLTPGSGVTINSASGNLVTNGQYTACTLYKTGTNTWLAVGNLTT